MLAKIVHAGVTNTSFQQGAEDLLEIGEYEVSAKQVERISERIGKERCAERDHEVEEHRTRPLAKRKAAPAGIAPPAVAVVGCDGGRIQILERANASPKTAAEEESLDPEAMKEESGRGGKHWREDKIGLLMTMTSDVSARDPCPEIPENFVDATRIIKLARELKKHPLNDDGLKEAAEPETVAETLSASDDDKKWEPPKVEEKRFIASRCRWPKFGPMLATAAWQGGFFAAERQAFVGDGSDNNWTIWRQHFSSFTPVLDFIHALSYVFAAAMAGRRFAEGWQRYVEWITWVWQGRVDRVIAALAQQQAAWGEPHADEAENSPRKIVAAALTYLQNHKDQMRYSEYRQQGLPITSSYVESAVKQFNQRVKGTEKFWKESGAESILQLRADYLSDNKPLIAFWQRREDSETGQRRYNRAA